MTKTRSISLIILLLFILFVFISLYFGYFLISPPGHGGKDKTFIVKKGAGLRRVAGELEKRGFLKSKELFMLWAFLKGGSRSIKAGEYNLNKSMPPVKLFNLLSSGAVKTYPVTIPEGLNIKQIADILEKKALASKEAFISIANEKKIAASYNIDGNGLEGYLFPDTYYINKSMDARSVIDLMINRFWNVFHSLGRDLEPPGPLSSVKEIVTLASIVEKETGRPEERPLIASVFINRLKRGMRLESDPTVIYGLKDFDGNLTREDLETPNPYNTYTNRGLPPGPISNPGKEALEAVFKPAETDYLYFVSKNDGSHYFSTSLSEHNRAVTKYQKRR